MPDGNDWLFEVDETGFESSLSLPVLYFRTLEKEGFVNLSCLVDSKGIIWITSPLSKYDSTPVFHRPCMRACYAEIGQYSRAVAKAVLALSCDVQNDKAITERALGYESC